MKITDISIQAKNPDRVNISVDGKYRFSLDVYQLGELGVKTGREYTEDELIELETESQFGKLYARALEYSLMRPHSSREIKDYLWRKTRTTKYKSKTGELRERLGVSQSVADRVFDRLEQRGYVNDTSFARYWVENRNQTKGASKRKLIAELRAKGIRAEYIETAFESTTRSDEDELVKVIAKKRKKYPDDEKLIQYLARQGFSYDDIKQVLQNNKD